MKLLAIVLLGTTLVASSAAMGGAPSERRARADTACCLMQEANLPARVAAYPEPEGHSQPQIA